LPSFVGTPLQLVLSGGEGRFTPARFSGSPLALVLSSGTVTVGPSLSTALSEIAGILDTLFASEAIVDDSGRPSRRFQQIWENTIGTIKDVLTGQGLSITELQNLYNALNAAQQTASSALQLTQAAAREKALTESYTSPLGVLTASSSGTITVAAHTRIYGDGTTASVNSGSVSGFASGDYVTVYYSDPARTGGAVTYLGTASVIGQTGDTHLVGQVTIPASGEVDAGGTGTGPPGWKYPPGFDPSFYNPL
jgi:hypothetical protein